MYAVPFIGQGSKDIFEMGYLQGRKTLDHLSIGRLSKSRLLTFLAKRDASSWLSCSARGSASSTLSCLIYTDQWKHYEHLAPPNAVGPLPVC